MLSYMIYSMENREDQDLPSLLERQALTKKNNIIDDERLYRTTKQPFGFSALHKCIILYKQNQNTTPLIFR